MKIYSGAGTFLSCVLDLVHLDLAMSSSTLARTWINKKGWQHRSSCVFAKGSGDDGARICDCSAVLWCLVA